MKLREFLLNAYNTYMCRVKVAHTYVKAIEENMNNYRNENCSIETMAVNTTLYRMVSFGSKDTHIINIMAHGNNDYPPFIRKEDFGNIGTDIFTIYIPMGKYSKYTYFQKINCMGKLYKMILHKVI